MKNCLFLLFLWPALMLLAEDTDRGYVVKAGDKMPEFTLHFPDGSAVRSKDLKGQVVMLQFTASWCGVCKKEMPHIEAEIWQVYQEKGLKLYGIDYKEPAEKVTQFAEATGITYPLALDEDGAVFHLFAKEKAGVTRNVIIDKKGRIVFLTRLFDREEFDQMKAVIHKLLEEN